MFEGITGRPAARAEGDSGGGRTIAYLDCMRDLDMTLGPALLDELRTSLTPVLCASRWWCGRVFDRGAELLGHIAHGRSGPLAPLLGELMGAGFGLWEQMGEEQRDLQRRWASIVAGETTPADAFADWTPAWHGSAYHSADLQIAATSTDAVARGDFLVVLGDFAGTFRAPLAHFLYLPIFVASLRSFDLIGEASGRAQIGRLVVRRASWSAPAAELPATPDELAAWAREHGLPRRVFARSPLQRKPKYVDFESPSLRRTLGRLVAHARERAPGAPVEFTEMLPGPDDCWLHSDTGHHTSELRIVALDRAPRDTTQHGRH